MTARTLTGRNPDGTFARGNVPTDGFDKHPERRGKGFWKREDTPRFKLEQMMKMTEPELLEVVKDESAPYFERKLAIAINQSDWKTIESMINQVYGQPKQVVEQTTIEVKPLIDLTKHKKANNGDNDGSQKD